MTGDLAYILSCAVAFQCEQSESDSQQKQTHTLSSGGDTPRLDGASSNAFECPSLHSGWDMARDTCHTLSSVSHVFIHTTIVTELANVWSPRAILVVFIKLTVMHSCTTQIGTLHYHELTIPTFRIKVFFYISQGTNPWATVLILGASNIELVHFANKVLVQHGGKRR